ncbi:MAG: NAD-dependent DNA ligase LigA [bacterium]
MDIETARTKAIELRKQLNEHNYKYYVLSMPEISDFEYDMLMKELAGLENEFPTISDETSPTRRVGSDISTEFEQVEHKYPMLSLGNTYSREELSEFDKRVQKSIGNDYEYVCELKYDGVSISLTYIDGKLKSAVTRGDGVRGDDVTKNVLTIKSIPMVLRGTGYPREFITRGEIFLARAGFQKLNEEKIERNELPFANPRNAASGTLKLKQSSMVARRPLDCFLYYLLGENLPYDNHYQNLEKCKEWGFKVPDTIMLCKNIHEVFDYIDHWENLKADLPYDIDGIVVKINSYSQRERLGFTSKTPRWAISFKYKAEQAETTLLSIDYQVGRTGAVTPVANLEPVQLAGTVVKRASVHNEDQLKLLDVRIYDKVYVEKGGEIIPKIVGVDKSRRIPGSIPVQFITSCPACGSLLKRSEGEAKHYCPNETGCPPQLKGKIEHFVSRRAMNIGVAEATVDTLFNKGLIHDYADLYFLKKEQILELDRFGEKSAENMIKSIEKSKQVPFPRVLYAIGTRYVGETVAKKLALHFKTLDNIMNASYEKLISVDEIGDRIALSILEFYQEDKNRKVIDKLKKAGVKLELEEEKAPTSSVLQGKNIVISGTFSKHSRDELKDLIELHGGKNISSVSKNTDYLLGGEGIGPSKLEKVKTLNIKIITEDDFLKMIGLS